MKRNNENETGFKVGQEFRTRALEVLDETQALQLAEGLRLGSALSNVHAREHNRIEQKYGEDHPRTQEMALRMEANENAKKVLFARHTEVSTPRADPGKGWAVDGFVRTADFDPVEGVTVAAYDRQDIWQESFGYACTNKEGYFSLVSEDLPDNRMPVFIRASKSRKLLESNEIRLVPAPNSSERVQIIISDTDRKDDCPPPSGGKGKRKHPPIDREKEVPKDENTGGKKTDGGSETEAQKKAREEERRRLEEEKKQAEEEAKKKAEEEERKKAREEEQRKLEEKKKRAEEEAKKKAEEEAKKKDLETERKKKVLEEKRKKAEEEKRIKTLEAEQKKKALAEKRKKVAAEKKKKTLGAVRKKPK